MPKRHLPTSPFKAPVTPAPKHFAAGDQVTRAQVRISSPYAKRTKL
ncbi:hypothetical protein [Streptomyces sp. NPDC004546]